MTGLGEAGIAKLTGGKVQILMTDVRYNVNRATLVELMASSVNETELTDISAARDESDETTRVVTDLAREGNEKAVMPSAHISMTKYVIFGCISSPGSSKKRSTRSTKNYSNPSKTFATSWPKSSVSSRLSKKSSVTFATNTVRRAGPSSLLIKQR